MASTHCSPEDGARLFKRRVTACAAAIFGPLPKLVGQNFQTPPTERWAIGARLALARTIRRCQR